MFMHCGIVYKIESNFDDKIYIGSTSTQTLKQILNFHINESKTQNTFFNFTLYNYGSENFKISPIIKIYDENKKILRQKLVIEKEKYILYCLEHKINLYNNDSKFLSIKNKINQNIKNNN